MVDRPPRPQTSILSADWKLEIHVEGKVATIDIEDQILIGRSVAGDPPGATLLDLTQFAGYQSGVSRHHAAITRHDGLLYIEDLGSTNGTRINGFQLTPRRKYRLRDGDEVEFARLRVVFRFVKPR